MPLSPQEILNASIDALIEHSGLLDQEQAVRGIDALSELQLHAIIGDALQGDGFGVFREAHYPSDGEAYTKQTHRNRCDLVLTPNPHMILIDPAHQLKELAIARETLFAGFAEVDPDPETTCPPDNAWWIEIKSCAQHAYRDGVPSPNPRYGHELVTGLQTDLCKLSADEQIWHGGSMIILFTESEEIARNDLLQATQICIEQGFPARTPLIKTGSITDRAGNGCVAIGLFPFSI